MAKKFPAANIPLVLYDASAPTYTYLHGTAQLTWNSGCKRGKAYAIVTASARYSFVGRTASLVQGAKDQGHFKAIMNSIGKAILCKYLSCRLDLNPPLVMSGMSDGFRHRSSRRRCPLDFNQLDRRQCFQLDLHLSC